jgi:hypothetical protein
VRIAKYFELIGRSLLAEDCTKFRAQNSTKNNFNQKKIDRQIIISINITEIAYNTQTAYVGFLMVAYNLRQLINIVGALGFKEYLESIGFIMLLYINALRLKWVNLRLLNFWITKIGINYEVSLNRLILRQNFIMTGGF